MRTTKQSHQARARTEEARSRRRTARKEVAEEVRALVKVARLARELCIAIGSLPGDDIPDHIQDFWEPCYDALQELPKDLLK